MSLRKIDLDQLDELRLLRREYQVAIQSQPAPEKKLRLLHMVQELNACIENMEREASQ